MNLKFAANLNFLFTEGAPSLASKIRLAAQAGFRAIEIPFPKDDLDEVVKAKCETGIEVSLMNIQLGTTGYEFGSACVPGAEEIFEKQLLNTIEVAKTLQCKKVHIMAGTIQGEPTTEHLNTYKRNLQHAAKCLQAANLIGVIEPINKYALPNYFMNSYSVATNVLRDINSEHLKLLVDIFHLQHICGNISNTLKELHNLIGHIQIAQAPHRHEPGVAGELDFQYIFAEIERIPYVDWIGCEYKPKNNTLDSLQWFSKFGIKH